MRPEDGGVVRAVLDLCATTPSAGTHITLVTTDASGVPDSWIHQPDGDRTVQTLPDAHRPAGLLDRRQLGLVAEHIRDADVVHLNSMWSAANIQIARRCVRLGKPYILTAHGMLDDWCMRQRRPKKVAFLKTFNRALVRHATLFHFTAHAELEQASAWIPRDKGVVVPLPLDLTPYRTLPGVETARAAFPRLGSGTQTILFLARLHEKKGLDRLIRAVSLLKEQGIEPQLLIAGVGSDDYAAKMAELAQSLGVADQTCFLGFVSGVLKVSLLQAADILALPTHQENFGFVFFEALAAGTPVLTTRGADTWAELSSSGGAMIEENTPPAIAAALGVLLADAPRRESMGRAGRAWVMEYFEPQQLQRAYRAMYEDALNRHKSRAAPR